jgi:hypothetical protein
MPASVPGGEALLLGRSRSIAYTRHALETGSGVKTGPSRWGDDG